MKQITHIRNKVLRLIFLSVFVLCCVFSTSGQAMLLNPHGDGTGHWEPNSRYDCNYLKPRFSYLCDREAEMLSLRRISYEEGMRIASNPANYYKRTCLSVTYNKNWVTDYPGDNNIKNNMTIINDSIVVKKNKKEPDVVYAYSVKRNETIVRQNGTIHNRACYDVYWFSEAEHPILKGECFNTFQNKYKENEDKFGSMLEDVSGISDWDFSEVTSLKQMFASCRRLTTVDFGEGQLYKVTTLENIFKECYSLSKNELSEIIGQWNLSYEYFPGNENSDTHLLTEMTIYNNMQVTTKNSIKYEIKNSHLTNGILLPITLSSYTISSHDNTITLSWTTESETNNDYFTVYASSDGVNFTDISHIDGAGTTSTSHSYSLTFDTSSIKYIYLSQTDFDGHTESFDIKPVVSAANLHKTFKYGPLNFRVVDNRLEYHGADN